MERIKVYICIILLGGHSTILMGQTDTLNDVIFLQGDRNYKITAEYDSIKLDKKPFSIRYYCNKYDESFEKFYSAHIAILPSIDDYSSLKVGSNTIGIPYFEPGSGIAVGENEMYESAHITNTGHHYLYYEYDEESRVKFISKNGKLLLLEWQISAFYYDNETIQIQDLKLSNLFFAI